MSGTATILGLAYESPVTEFTVRTGPGTTFDKASFQASKDTADLIVLDVQPDSTGTKSDYGRIYQWFNLQFSDGQTGWMRDHVIGILGDFTTFGYGKVYELKHAYLMVRDMEKAAAVAAAKAAKEAQVAADKAEKASKADKAATADKGDTSTTTDQSTVPSTNTDQVAPIMTKKAGIVKPSGPPTATIKTRSGAYTRSGPSINGFQRQFIVPRNESVPIQEVQLENMGQRFRWYRIEYQNQAAWIREDLVAYGGDTTDVGLPWDLYPAPMDERWWIRDYNRQPNMDTFTWEHAGWDFGAIEGELIRCGPLGGTVVRSIQCTKCTPDKPSTVLQGLGLNNQAVFTDEGWGDGYGNYVIVGYNNDQLPDSTKQKIADMGFGGGSVFVLYGHMHDRRVEAGDVLDPNEVIGSCGNTGNSEATHLHLEVRVSKDNNFTNWYNLRGGLTSPIILFNR